MTEITSVTYGTDRGYVFIIVERAGCAPVTFWSHRKSPRVARITAMFTTYWDRMYAE